MKRLIGIYLLLFILPGCSTIEEMGSSVANRYEASQKLSAARLELEQGKAAAASAIFEEIIAKPDVMGVTDEALFRLSLLKLPYDEKDLTSHSIRYLERLRINFPESSWTMQSKPLYDFLKVTTEIRKQNRNLKLHNISLNRDNKELRQSIDRLNSLDMKLERKAQ